MPFAQLLWLLVVTPAGAQDPYKLAPQNYQSEFENDWVRVSRVRYKPGDRIAVHDHPAVNTVYVYLTDGGEVRFGHQEFAGTARPAVKAGAVRFARASKETHDTAYLGDQPSEYLRVELKTDPGGTMRNQRIAADAAGPVETAQARIVRLRCGDCQPLPRPSVVVDVEQRWGKFLEAGAVPPQGANLIQIELRTGPAR